MNRTFFDKLKSRKLWAAIVGVVVGIAAAFGLDESEWVQVAGVVTSAASVVAYIFGESKIDAAASVPIVIPSLGDGEKEKPEGKSGNE